MLVAHAVLQPTLFWCKIHLAILMTSRRIDDKSACCMLAVCAQVPRLRQQVSQSRPLRAPRTVPLTARLAMVMTQVRHMVAACRHLRTWGFF